MVTMEIVDASKNFGDEDIFYAEEIEIKDEVSHGGTSVVDNSQKDIFHSLDVQNEIIIDKDTSIAKESNSYEQAIQNLNSVVAKYKVPPNKSKKRRRDPSSSLENVKITKQAIYSNLKSESPMQAKVKSFFGSSMGVSKCHICNKFTKRSCFEAHMQEHFQNGKKPKVEKQSSSEDDDEEDDETKAFDNIKPNSIDFPEVFKCSQCSFCASTKSEIEDHSDSHIDNKPLMCTLCNFSSDILMDMKTHMDTHYDDGDHFDPSKLPVSNLNDKQKENKSFKCKLCNYKTLQLTTLKNHLRKHYGENLYSCSYCDYQSVDKNALTHHLKTHTGEKLRSCKICDYQCKSKSSLKVHMKTHNDDEVFNCSSCNFTTKSKPSLARHELLHMEEKPHKCLECAYQTAQKAALRAHMQRHKGEKPFECPECDYSSVEKTHLIRHMRQHTGEKPIFCFVCDYRCIQFGCLVTHVKRHNDTLMQCAFCHFNTIKSDALICHLRAEHKRSWGKAPLQCPVCSFKCFTKENLKKHTLNHDNEAKVEESEPFISESDSEAVKKNVYHCKKCDFETTNKKYLKSHKKKEH